MPIIHSCYYQLVLEDFKALNLNLSEKQIIAMSKYQYKKVIEQRIYEAAFYQYLEKKCLKSKLLFWSHVFCLTIARSHRITLTRCGALPREAAPGGFRSEPRQTGCKNINEALLKPLKTNFEAKPNCGTNEISMPSGGLMSPRSD